MNNTKVNEEKAQEKQDVTETKAGCSCCGGRTEKK